jgi:hypothetical protein
MSSQPAWCLERFLKFRYIQIPCHAETFLEDHQPTARAGPPNKILIIFFVDVPISFEYVYEYIF